MRIDLFLQSFLPGVLVLVSVGAQAQVQIDADVGIHKTAERALDVGGTARARTFVSSSGEFSVEYGEEESVPLTFEIRAAYIVRATWCGRHNEGTRVWFVLTQNNMNHYTGFPTIIEVGRTEGPYHHADNLHLEVSSDLEWNQLRLRAVKEYGSLPSAVRWSLTQLAGY